MVYGLGLPYQMGGDTLWASPPELFAVENLALAWFDRDGGMMLPAAKRRCDH